MLACWAASTLRETRSGMRPARLARNASLSTISHAVSLSFQSAFHLSITLLVRYRSLAGIEP